MYMYIYKETRLLNKDFVDNKDTSLFFQLVRVINIIHTYADIHMHIYTCIYTYAYIHIYIYTYIK